MKKRILLPTDFSRNAWDAIAYAVDLFKDEQCEFYLLNVFDFTGYSIDNIVVSQPNNEYAEKIKENSLNGLEQILQRLSFRDESEKHSFMTISRQDNLLDAIRDTVELKDIDLVVMGTKGDTDAVNIAFGSNTVMVMEKERNCPVLAIPPNTTYSPPSEIVFPTSFRTHFKKRELQYLTEISGITGSPIRILHVKKEAELDDIQENYKKLLQDCFEGVEYTFHEMEDNDIADAVEMFVESRGSGMIAFINKKHNFFRSIFSKPLVKELGTHSKVPVLALHDLRN